MHTIKLQLDDNLYEDIIQSGIDIKEKFNEFLKFELLNDKYPAITAKEAKSRVSKAVKDYQDGTGEYFTSEEYNIHKKKHIEELKAKYADN